MKVADTLEIGRYGEILGGSTVEAKNVQLTNRGHLYVGIDYEDVYDAATNSFSKDTYTESTGYLQADILGLNGGTLAVDPAYGQAAALAAVVDRFDEDTVVSPSEQPYTGGVVKGQLLIGANGALGVGYTLDELKSALADWNLTDSNGSLIPEQYGAALVIGQKAVRFSTGSGVVLTAQSLYGTDGTRDGGSFLYGDTVNNADSTIALTHSGIANGMYLGANTVTVFEIGDSSGTISFESNDAKLVADGGDVLLTGNVRARTNYTLFSDGNGGVSVVNTKGVSTETLTGAADEAFIKVTTLNGVLEGYLYGAKAGTVYLELAPDARVKLSGASDPVYNSIVAYANGFNDWQAEQPRDELVGIGYTEASIAAHEADPNQPLVHNPYNNELLNSVLISGNGADAETVARLATYGGAVQAAITAGASSYEAISGRLGMGATGYNLTVADNTQGAALWVSPLYKSSESDSFDAEGVDYGVDLDLYGVALGADYTLANGISFGAMFNVGSGDVDGKDAGSAVSNDFDYYGFGVYGGYSVDNFKVVADLTYTVADNDLEGNTAIDKVGASLDTSNLSFGVTAQYAFDFTGATVTPHAGLRYSYIDMDDYDVDGEGTVATYDGDSLGIFSIPVGVTIAKEFVGDNWSVKPSFDLTLTGNFGDDETDGTVHWAGVENLSTNVSSEVIDNFTYGATLGVAAKTGNFSLGLGVNYTGSSNTDEYGVNANARFVF